MKSSDHPGFLGRPVETWFFWLLIIIHLIPVWLFSYVPTQDGPTHLENAVLLTSYTDSGNQLVRKYYEINFTDPSNWAIQLLLAGLSIFFPPLNALKILISLYIVFLPVSFRFCLFRYNPQPFPALWLIFPFIYNYLLHMGFFGFCYSLIFFFYTFGFWMKIKDQLTLTRGIALSLLFLVTYLFHVVSLVMVLSVICVSILLAFFHENPLLSGAVDLMKKRLEFVWLTALPVILFLLYFFSLHGPNITYQSAFSDRLIQLAGLTSLYSFVRSELFISCTVSSLIFILSLTLLVKKWQYRQWREPDLLLLLVIFSCIIYFTAPDTIATGSVINARLLLYPYFILLIWLGTFHWRQTIQRIIVAVIIIVCGIQLSIVVHNYRQTNEYIGSYLSVSDLLEPGTVLLPLSFYDNRSAGNDNLPGYRINPFIHLSSYLPLKTQLVQLGNYQAWFGCFPVQYRSQMDPMKNLAVNGQLESIPPVINIQSYLQKTDSPIDYILIWGLEDRMLSRSVLKSVLHQITQGYSLLDKSQPFGTRRLYHSDQRRPPQKTDHMLAYPVHN